MHITKYTSKYAYYEAHYELHITKYTSKYAYYEAHYEISTL